MSSTIDTTVNNLIINKLTKVQYENIQNPSDTELYLVPDEIDTSPTSGSDNYVTSGGVYTALQNKTDKVIPSSSGNIATLDLSGNIVDSGMTSSSIVSVTSVGSANGVCPLDGNSLVDSQYLPSYVDDIIEAYARTEQIALSSTWLATGSSSGQVIVPASGVIYILMEDTTDYSANTQFRWGGTTYVKINDGGVSPITNAEIDTITNN